MIDCDCWQCTRPGATREDYLAELRRKIDQHGWAVQGVTGTRERAAYAYTVGLTEQDLPELVVTGRSLTLAASMLNAIADYAVSETVIRSGETMHLGDLHLEAVALPHPEAHLFVATDLYGAALRGLQMVWADDRGRLPWERGHRAGRGGQPVFGPREDVLPSTG